MRMAVVMRPPTRGWPRRSGCDGGVDVAIEGFDNGRNMETDFVSGAALIEAEKPRKVRVSDELERGDGKAHVGNKRGSDLIASGTHNTVVGCLPRNT